MLFKRCEHDGRSRLSCDHPWWVRGKKKPLGRVRESLEVYFDRLVRGRGSKTLAKDLERIFLVDLRTGKYAAWKKR